MENEEYPSRLVGGVDMWNGVVPHPDVVGKNSGEVFQDRGVPATPRTKA